MENKRFTLTAENRAEVMPRIGDYLRVLKIDKPVSVVISERKETRRSQQNRLMWKWFTIIGDEIGYTRQEVHDLLIYDVLGMITKTIHGKEIETLASTHDLPVGDFADFLTRVKRFADNLNIRLPEDV